MRVWNVNKSVNVVFVDFKSLFNARFPSSLRTCKLRFQLPSLRMSENVATKFASSFPCFNFVCKQMFMLDNNQFNEIQTFLVAHWTKNMPLNCYFNLNHEYLFTIVQTLKCNLRTLFRSSRPILNLETYYLGTARWKVTWNRQ